MDRALIIYYKEEGKKNSKFIDLFKKNGMKYGITFDYVSFENFKKHSDVEERLKDYSFVLNRTRHAELSLFFEKRGIKCYNSSRIVNIANDKFLTYRYINDRVRRDDFEALIPKTAIMSGEGFCKQFNISQVKDDDKKNGDILFFNEYFKAYQYIDSIFMNQTGISGSSKYIVKTLNGHGGTEVILLEKQKRLYESFNQIIPLIRRKNMIIQEYIETQSRDLRVYVLNGEIYATVLRQGDGSFKSNYSLGGKISLYELNSQEREYVNRFISKLNPKEYGFIGIDFLVGEDNRLYFNEIEEMVGCRMLYALTDKDIVDDFLSTVAN